VADESAAVLSDPFLRLARNVVAEHLFEHFIAKEGSEGVSLQRIQSWCELSEEMELSLDWIMIGDGLRCDVGEKQAYWLSRAEFLSRSRCLNVVLLTDVAFRGNDVYGWTLQAAAMPQRLSRRTEGRWTDFHPLEANVPDKTREEKLRTARLEIEDVGVLAAFDEAYEFCETHPIYQRRRFDVNFEDRTALTRVRNAADVYLKALLPFTRPCDLIDSIDEFLVVAFLQKAKSAETSDSDECVNDGEEAERGKMEQLYRSYRFVPNEHTHNGDDLYAKKRPSLKWDSKSHIVATKVKQQVRKKDLAIKDNEYLSKRDQEILLNQEAQRKGKRLLNQSNKMAAGGARGTIILFFMTRYF
jgi:hypothetical protein